jgi:hypothetical protein
VRNDANASSRSVETIFRKIDNAAVFVPDLTFVGTRPDGRPTPNPNVLIEYGWALKSLTHARIVPVMNISFGEPTAESMPFDMRHLRNPITYHCSDDLSDAERRQSREKLTKDLEHAVRAVFESDEFKGSLPQAAETRSLYCARTFRRPRQIQGTQRSVPGFFEAPEEIQFFEHPASWFRIMPTCDPGRTWSVAELERAMKQPLLHPLSRDWHGFGFLRGPDGYGVYATFADAREKARALVYTFTTGELWTVDTYWLESLRGENRNTVPNVDQQFRQTLKDYADFMRNLGIKPSYRWVAGMEDLKGRDLFVPAPPGLRQRAQTRFLLADGDGADHGREYQPRACLRSPAAASPGARRRPERLRCARHRANPA